MNIFKTIGKSIYGPEFYATLATESKSSAAKYYFKFLLLLALLGAIIFSIVQIPRIRAVLSVENVSTLTALYPAELAVSVKEGKFVTNVKEPYQIPVKDFDTTKDEPANAVVIDTKADAVSFETFKKYDTYVLVNKDSVISIKENGILQIAPVAEYFPVDFVLTQTWINAKALEFLPMVRSAVWILPILVYLGFYSSGIFALVLMFAYALLTWLLLVILRKDRGYSYAYVITLHSASLALILGALFSRLPWYVSLIVTLAVILVNLMKPSAPTETVTPVAPAV
jgi:hypothetical protein